MSRKTGRKVRGFTPAALKKMEQYEWPGSVRELRNVVERAVALGAGPMLDAADIWLLATYRGGRVAARPQLPAQPTSLPRRLLARYLGRSSLGEITTSGFFGKQRSR